MGDEDAAKHLFALGSQAAKDSNYGVAYAQFSEALENASSVELKSAVLISRSRTLGALSRWGEALADAEECRKIRPSWSRAFEYKAAALAGLGRAAEAEICNRLAAALASLKQDPKSEELKKDVRAIRQELAAFESSSETHQQSAAATHAEAPSNPGPTPPTLAAPALATAPEADGQPQAECEIAKDSFQKGTKVNKAGNHNEAYQFFSQGLSTARTVELQSALLVSRSAALCGMNRYQEALVDAVECVKIRKSWARSYSCQEAALNGLGRTEEAGRCRRLASALANLKQDPKNEDFKTAVRAIRQEMAEHASKQALGAPAPAPDSGPKALTLPETTVSALSTGVPPVPSVPVDPPMEVTRQASPPPAPSSPPAPSEVTRPASPPQVPRQASPPPVLGPPSAKPPPDTTDLLAASPPPPAISQSSDSEVVPQTVVATPAAGTPAETDEAKRLVSQANQLQRQNNFQGAHEQYTNALRHVRNDELRSAIFFNRSVALARMKRWEESLEDANECVKINPTWPRGAECQGTALEGLGRLQEALAAFGTALRLEPGNEAIKQTMRDIRQSLMKSENPLFTQQISNPASMLPHPTQHKSPPTLVGTLPQLIKSSCSYDAGADAYVQVDVERNRRWAKWTVNRCDSGIGKISFRDFFPNFPLLNHAHSGMNEVLSHAVRVHGIKTHNVPGSPARTNLTLTIPPPSECNSKVISSVLLDRCTGPLVLVDEIEDEIQMIGCRDVELVVGGHPPKSGLMLSDCSNCHIVVSDKIWRMSGKGGDDRGSIRTNSSSAIYLVLVGGGPEHHGAAMNAISISTMRQDRQNVEKVLIPDCFTTVLKDGALSTSCGFSSDFSADIFYPPKQEEQPAVASQPSMPVHSPSIAPAALPMTGIMYSPVQQPKAVEPTREEKTKSEALATPFLGSGVLQFKLQLALNGTAIDAGSYRRNFEIALANDLANSSNLAENNFRVISMVGNLVVNVEALLKVQEGVYLDSMQLVSILEQQYGDSTSRFRNGVITQYTQGIGFPFDLGSGVVGFKHKLDIPFRDVGTEGSVERLKFQNKYLFDLCNASSVEATRFHIKNCAPGSIIIEIEIHPDASGRGPLARNVFANLDKQAMDPESQLRVGVVTRSTKAEAQVGRSGQLPGCGGLTQIQMPPDLPPAIPFDAGAPPAIPFDAGAVQKQALPQPPTTPPAPTYRSSLQLKEQNGSSSPEQLVGARVRVHGLQNNIEFNNSTGTVLGAADGGRFRVLLDGEGVGYELGLKPENFSVAPGQMHQQAQAGTAAATDQREVKPLSAPSGAPIDARLYQQVPPQVNSQNDQINQPSPSKRVGIGLGLSMDEKGNIRVSDILPGSICAREGSIQRNDVIERVDGAPVDGMEPNNVVALLRGHENSFVKLDMKRNKWNLTDPTLDIRYSVMLERTPVLQPPSPAHVSLTLDMHMWQIGDYDNFMREVAVDVASALGSMVTKVKAVGLRSGSVIVDLLLTPEVGRTGPHIVEELIEQARSPSSILRNGKHTSRTVGVHSAPSNPVHSGPPPENRQATISSSVSKPIPRTRPSPMTGTLGPSSAFRDNKIVREAEMEIRYNYSSASRGGAPVPLVPQPESVAWANEKRATPRAGIGLGLTAGKGLVYTVTGLTPGGAAEASGQLQKGDIVHSIDGMIVTGKTVAEIQDVVIGEAGTKVMVAVLRSDALPEDLELDLHQFERWRPVVLVRSIPRFHNEIQQQNGCNSQQSVSSIGHHGGNMSAQKSVWPMRNGREIIAVDLVLNEDYRVVASTFADKDSFTVQATHDISTALRVSSTQVAVVDLLPGSVIVVVEFLYAGDHAGARDPEDLALEIMRQASNESSPLRQSVSCRRAKYARPRMMKTLMPLKAEATHNGSSSQPASDDDMSSMEGGGQWMALGLVLSNETLDRFCAVKFLRHGGPAEQSGCIFTGNLVISINGRSMDGVSLDQVVNILGEGDWGTVVNVGIMRLRGTKGALPDQNITTVVALRRGLRQMSSVASPLLSPSQPDAPQATSETESYKLEYTGPCRIVVLQRKFDPMKTRVGVGIVLQRLLSSQQLVVVRMPETGVAAASEQVFIGDVLHQVDNVPTSGRSLEDVVRMLQGLPGTPVVLMLQSTTRQKEALQASSHSHLFSSRRSDTNRSTNMPSHVTLRRIYPTPDESTPFRTLRDGSPAGVVGLGLEHEDHSVVISKMAANGSAAQSGMIPIGSRLMSVDGTNVELASLDEIYLLLSGRVDTEVTVGFLPVIQDFVEILTTQDFMEIPLSVEAPLDTPFLQSPERTNAKGLDSATVSMLLIEATNLTEKRQGDSVECKIRLLHPSRKPIVLGAFKGTWNAVSGKVEFEGASCVFDIKAQEVDKAQIEAICDFQEVVHDGQEGRGFVGEVIVNANRLHAMAKQQPANTLNEHELSQDFEFGCKPGWTFKPVRQVEAQMSIRLNYKAR